MTSNLSEQALFETVLSVSNLSDADFQKARNIFIDYLDKKIFENCTFDDTTWCTTDEYSKVSLIFNLEELSYKRYYEPVFQIKYDEFITYIKVFILYTMGKNVLKTLQTFTNDLKRIIRTNPNEIYGASAKLQIAVPSLCIDFLSMLPESSNELNKDDLVNALDYYISVNYRKSTVQKRNLAQFDSYFLFHDILTDYWNSELDRDERLFYYPLYLWWQITGVIPLRPREFILTKRDCLEKRTDGYYLTLRRNKLKGCGKSIHYKISEDYFEETYKIPDRLANEIKNYLEFTKDYEHTELNTLFVADSHYKHWGQKKHSNSRYFTYINMNTVMRYFFHDVINQKYGMKVVYQRTDGHLKPNEINYLHLGDTRHLALINIIAEGGSPVTAMLLAGHDNMEMASHYYSNITNLIECRTYRQYRLVTKGEVSYRVSLNRELPTKNANHIALTDGGRCYSENYQNGSIKDCMECVGPSGELGYCPTCRFYRNKGKEYFSIDDIYKRKIAADCKNLSETVHLVRLSKGNSEDIGEALLKLQSSSYTYQEYCKEKMTEQNARGENAWEERK